MPADRGRDGLREAAALIAIVRARLVRSAADIEPCRTDGTTGVLLAREESDGLERSLNTLHALSHLGLR